jgi:hypothetical protein
MEITTTMKVTLTEARVLREALQLYRASYTQRRDALNDAAATQQCDRDIVTAKQLAETLDR